MKKSTKILIGVPLLIIGTLIVFIRFNLPQFEFVKNSVGVILMFIGTVLLASLLPGKPSRPDPWDF